MILALHHDARLMRTPGALQRAQRAFDRLVAHHLDSAPAAAAAPRRPRH